MKNVAIVKLEDIMITYVSGDYKKKKMKNISLIVNSLPDDEKEKVIERLSKFDKVNVSSVHFNKIMMNYWSENVNSVFKRIKSKLSRDYPGIIFEINNITVGEYNEFITF